MSNLNVRTESKPRVGHKLGQVIGVVLVLGATAVVLSAIVWGLVAIWRGILGV